MLPSPSAAPPTIQTVPAATAGEDGGGEEPPLEAEDHHQGEPERRCRWPTSRGRRGRRPRPGRRRSAPPRPGSRAARPRTRGPRRRPRAARRAGRAPRRVDLGAGGREDHQGGVAAAARRRRRSGGRSAATRRRPRAAPPRGPGDRRRTAAPRSPPTGLRSACRISATRSWIACRLEAAGEVLPPARRTEQQRHAGRHVGEEEALVLLGQAGAGLGHQRARAACGRPARWRR